MLKIINKIVTKNSINHPHLGTLNNLLNSSNNKDNSTLDFSSDNLEDDIIKILVYEDCGFRVSTINDCYAIKL